MDVRERLVELLDEAEEWADHKCDELDCETCYAGKMKGNCVQKLMVDRLIAHGVTVQEWTSVKERTPTEADGTVWVCLADVFPYNEKEPYIDAKHDRRITEAFYSQFSKRWYKDGAVFPNGIVTHWMEKAQPPKGE